MLERGVVRSSVTKGRWAGWFRGAGRVHWTVSRSAGRLSSRI